MVFKSKWKTHLWISRETASEKEERYEESWCMLWKDRSPCLWFTYVEITYLAVATITTWLLLCPSGAGPQHGCCPEASAESFPNCGVGEIAAVLEHWGPCCLNAASLKSSKSECASCVELLESSIKTINLIYEMITHTVKSTREMHYLTRCLMMVFSLELNTASVVIIYVLYRWGSHKWISKPFWGQYYYTDFLLLSKSFCFWQSELTTKWKCVPPT